jgi:hypothetical protein
VLRKLLTPHLPVFRVNRSLGRKSKKRKKERKEE